MKRFQTINDIQLDITFQFAIRFHYTAEEVQIHRTLGIRQRSLCTPCRCVYHVERSPCTKIHSKVENSRARFNIISCKLTKSDCRKHGSVIQ